MRFLIFLLDSFIITLIANGIVEWKYRLSIKKGYYQMLFTCGIWLGFVYSLQYVNQCFPRLVKVIMAMPMVIIIIIAKPYYKHIKELK